MYFLSLPIKTTHLLPIYTMFSFHEHYIKGITQSIRFWDWLFKPDPILEIHESPCINEKCIYFYFCIVFYCTSVPQLNHLFIEEQLFYIKFWLLKIWLLRKLHSDFHIDFTSLHPTNSGDFLFPPKPLQHLWVTDFLIIAILCRNWLLILFDLSCMPVSYYLSNYFLDNNTQYSDYS